LSSAEAGLKSFSTISLGFAAAFVEAFLDLDFVFDFVSSLSDADFEDARFRSCLAFDLLAAESDTSFKGTLVVVEAGAAKNSLVTDDLGVASFGAAYCSVTKSVMVLGFFLGALTFSGEVLLFEAP
jgi:hypothetical protein